VRQKELLPQAHIRCAKRGVTQAIEFSPAGNHLVFSAESTGSGRELWVSDGTESGTTLLADIWPGGPDDFGRFPSDQPRLLTPLGSRTAFSALSPTIGDEPWITDGTVAGTRPMGDVAPNAGAIPTSTPTGFVEGAGSIWFAAGDGNQRFGNELRRWNGLDSPTLVRDLAPLWVNRPLGNFGNYSGPASANPTALVPVGSRLFFRATDPIYGDKLHVSDGTPTATRRVRNLHPGSIRPRLPMRKDRSRLLASGYDGRLALLLDCSPSGSIRSWATPAAAAADLLAESNAGWMFVTTNGLPGALRHARLHDWRDNASEPVSRLEALDLWRIASGAGFTWAAGLHTNNTPVLWRIPPVGDPVVVANLGVSPADTLFQSVELNGQFLFAAGGSLQRELWAGDGTAEGTALVQDLLPGAMSSDPTDLLSFGERLAYLAQDEGDDIALRTVSTSVSPYEAWLASYPLPPGFPRDPDDDGDGDGASNLLEFLYRTSPIDPRDKFGLTSVRAVPGILPTLEITYLRPGDWRSRGMNYQLEFTQRFGGWSVLAPSRTTVENIGSMERVTVEVQAELRMDEFFVRLRVSGL
jgi:ELWxxDGT repeat protein